MNTTRTITKSDVEDAIKRVLERGGTVHPHDFIDAIEGIGVRLIAGHPEGGITFVSEAGDPS